MTQTRSEILKALAEMSERYPEWRFAQLVIKVSVWAGAGESIWDVEDSDFLTAVSNHLRKNPN
jgi:hypothetical protein